MRRLTLATAKLSKLEFQIMEVLWTNGDGSIRDMLQALPGKKRPAYTTIQTTVNRMEAKGVVARVGQVGTSHIYRPMVTREKAQRALVEDLLSIFGGRSQPVMAHLVESGSVSLEDIKDAEAALRRLSKGGKR
ncbi:BlaI/MecI/CopY family transcriptional regulator [Silvibacterium sp.]|uniref:BlaI/MecI/CopY family transcriptional regulator n=1 Tax=Silvibacterium sp. TaxID=1964179 RepID=UPI0039E547CE